MAKAQNKYYIDEGEATSTWCSSRMSPKSFAKKKNFPVLVDVRKEILKAKENVRRLQEKLHFASEGGDMAKYVTPKTRSMG